MVKEISNKNLKQANKEKKAEFYTQITDIEKEVLRYKKHFKGKTVFCNCDDPEISHFWKFFSLTFEDLKIKKLISTHYKKNKPSYKLEISKDLNKDGKINKLDTKKTRLKQNGDFRSQECIEILKQSDIIVTNPPFFLWKEYLEQLFEYKKKFLIIGNVNALSYKKTFSKIKEKKLWLGHSIKGGDREFRVPKDYPLKAAGYRTDDQGNNYIRVKSVRWFTNLDYKERYYDLELYKKYRNNKKDYPKYVNYDAINLNVTKDSPKDYEGHIGVPLTFMDRYNPSQFDIIALGIVGSIEFTSEKKMEILDKKNARPTGKFTKNAKGTLYTKYDPKNSERKKPPAFKDINNGQLYQSHFARIIIKRIESNLKKCGA